MRILPNSSTPIRPEAKQDVIAFIKNVLPVESAWASLLFLQAAKFKDISINNKAITFLFIHWFRLVYGLGLRSIQYN